MYKIFLLLTFFAYPLLAEVPCSMVDEPNDDEYQKCLLEHPDPYYKDMCVQEWAKRQDEGFGCTVPDYPIKTLPKPLEELKALEDGWE